ncbi:MAG: spermidine/putrescine ABC transporter substrate-binding protein [Actinomycetia bacterium]|nr:spermidine/putrescine ABC transporter substrate-binding protein [Actinomycetes bacterium]
MSHLLPSSHRPHGSGRPLKRPGRPAFAAKTLSRRSFLVGLGAAGLAACTTDAGSASEFDLGGSNRLTMLTWADYIDPTENGEAGTIDRFSSDFGISVNYIEEYSDNYDGYDLVLTNAINSSEPSYDIVVPTNWRAAQMIEQGWAEPLPIEIIPNHANLDPLYMTNAWDRGSRFQMPWQAGITGIAYDPALTGRPINSIEDLFDPEFKGRVGVIGEMREAVGLAMLANGDDPSRPTVAAAEAGLARIQDAVESGQVGAVTFGDFADQLDQGQLVAAMAWSGDTALLRDSRPDIEFVIPDEGGIQWFDSMVIPKDAPNIRAAGEFMNYVYDPINAARITAWVGYISPVLGVREELLKGGGDLATLADNPILFPDDATRNRLFTWGGLDQENETRIDDAFNLMVP